MATEKEVTAQDAQCTIIDRQNISTQLWFTTWSYVVLSRRFEGDASLLEGFFRRFERGQLGVSDWVLLIWAGLEGRRQRVTPQAIAATEEDAAMLVDRCGGFMPMVAKYAEQLRVATAAGLGMDPRPIDAGEADAGAATAKSSTSEPQRPARGFRSKKRTR